jgi:hypothetical protein
MSVRPVRLDSVSGARLSAWHWVFALASILALAAAAGAFIHVTNIHRVLTRESQQAEDLRRARHAPPMPLTRAQSEQIHALNPYIVALNLPWDEVFKAVRPSKGRDVYLLGLDAEPGAARLRIDATTSSFEAMTGYVSDLAARPGLADVYLVKHEIPKEGGYRFEVEARWAP